MNKILPLLMIPILLLVGCGEQPKLAEKSLLISFADSLFQTSVDSAYIAGASVLVFQNGQGLLDKSYGLASIELSVPMPETPVFEIGSVTKQFTAAAILRLVEQGKLSLDDDFTKYVKFNTKGRKVTIGHLLNHTSGIESYTDIDEFWDLSVREFKRDTLVRIVEQKDFLFEPGEALIYNNSGYFLLGLVIEKIAEMNYEEFLKQQFFTPLGMNNTGYSSNSKIVPNKVYGYDYSKEGLLQRGYLDHTWPFAAGSLYSSTDDLLTWMNALHHGEVFKDEMYQRMTTPGTLNDGSQLRYAMGLDNYLNFGNREIGHGGGINGFLSQASYFPDSDLYVICLVNTTGPKGAGFFADRLTWKLLDKQEYKTMELDIDPGIIAGEYSGQVRGRKLTVNVGALEDGITILPEGRENADTLRTYVGNSTWMDGNSIMSFSDDKLITDQIGGHYIMKKKKD